MNEQNFICRNHGFPILYVCSNSHCGDSRLVCQKCKHNNPQHFYHHEKHIMTIKDFFDSFKSKISLPFLERSLRQCSKGISHYKNFTELQSQKVSQMFTAFRKQFQILACEYEASIQQAIKREKEKFDLTFSSIQADLAQYQNEIQQLSTSVKKENEQMIQCILKYRFNALKTKEDLQNLKNQIDIAKSTLTIIDSEDNKKSQLKNFLQNFSETFFNLTIDSSSEEKKSLTMKTSCSSDNFESKNNLQSLNQISVPRQMNRVILPELNYKVRAKINQLSQFKLISHLKKPSSLTEGPYPYLEGVYLGQYKDNKRDGIGIFIFKDGSLYEGQWRNDQPSGYCRLTKAESIYEGQIQDGKASGFGKYQSDKKIYEGQWKEDQRHGKGQQTLKDTKRHYKGGFQNDKYEGKGQLTQQDYQYVGSFKSGVFEANGVIKYKNGDCFDGIFVNGKKYMGSHTFNGSCVYSGMFRNDLPDGTGTYTWEDGTKYEGQWKNGKQQGRGIQTMLYGQELKGVWQDGKWINWI